MLKRRSLWTLGSGYAVASLVGFTLIDIAPVDATDTPTGWSADVGAVVLLAVLVAALIQQRTLRRQAYARLPAASDPAVALVEYARRKRQEARALAERDPQMARDLRIGRPDLSRQFDDGGLVDLNAAPAEVIANMCRIPLPAAQSVVETRGRLGRLSSVEEAAVYANLTDEDAEALKDKGIVLPSGPSPSHP